MFTADLSPGYFQLTDGTNLTTFFSSGMVSASFDLDVNGYPVNPTTLYASEATVPTNATPEPGTLLLLTLPLGLGLFYKLRSS